MISLPIQLQIIISKNEKGSKTDEEASQEILQKVKVLARQISTSLPSDTSHSRPSHSTTTAASKHFKDIIVSRNRVIGGVGEEIDSSERSME